MEVMYKDINSFLTQKTSLGYILVVENIPHNSSFLQVLFLFLIGALDSNADKGTSIKCLQNN